MSRPPQSNRAPNPAPDDPVAFTAVVFTAAGQLSDETLTAWLDDPGAFRPADAERIRTHLRQDAASREALDDLHLVVSALGNLPEIEPTRSFALSAQVAHAARPVMTTRPAVRPPTPVAPVVRLQESSVWQARQQRTLRWASAVAAMLLVFVLSVDAFTGDRNDDAISSKNEMFTMGVAAPAGGNAEVVPPSVDQSGGSEGYDAQSTVDDMGMGGGEDTGEGAAPSSGDATGGSETGNDDDTARSMATPATADLEYATGMADETTVPGVAAGSEPEQDMGMGGDAETAAADTMSVAAEPMATAPAAAEPGASVLQLLEFGLALTVLWLLIALVGLPWLRQRATYRRR